MSSHDELRSAFSSVDDAHARVRQVTADILLRLSNLPTSPAEVTELVKELARIYDGEREWVRTFPETDAYETNPAAKAAWSVLHQRRNAAIEALTNYGRALIEAGK